MKKTIIILKSGKLIETRNMKKIYTYIYQIDYIKYNGKERWDFLDFCKEIDYNSSKNFIKFAIDFLIVQENNFVDMIDMNIRYAQKYAGTSNHCPYGKWMASLNEDDPDYRYMLEKMRFVRLVKGENVDDWDEAIEKERNIAYLKRIGKWHERIQKKLDLLT